MLGIIWTYFRLPEPKGMFLCSPTLHYIDLLTISITGLTYGELDVLFENRVSARKFRKVAVDPYRSDNLVIVPEEESSDQDVYTEKKELH